MLQRAAVEPGTLAVLDRLMAQSFMDNFVLVGGTALALHLGHRLSIDIDLFCQKKFDIDELEIELNESIDNYKLINKTGLGIHAHIDGVKSDFIYFPFEYIKPLIVDEGVRLLSMEDIAAMKVNAIYKRGSKKDFYDIYFLLDEFSFEEILHFFSVKFPNSGVFGLARSLAYFDDAELQEDPIVLKENVSWIDVKRRITDAVRKYM